MNIEEITLDHQYVLNQSGNILINDTPTVTATSSSVFPVIDTYFPDKSNYNLVTFIYANKKELDVFLVGSFNELYNPIKLTRVMFNNVATGFYAVTLKIPSRGFFYYRFKINNQLMSDPLNPLTHTLDNGSKWSAFFTQDFKTPIVFENWEIKLLQRFVSFILPFKTDEFKTFVNRHYSQFDNTTRSLVSQTGYDIGVVNFIDKLLARQERHHILNYQLCLSEMKQVLFKLNNTQEPEDMDEYFYDRLYDIMNNDNFDIWQKSSYDHPSYFLKVLRRHIVTAAFSHPKHGGNTQALGWQFLAEILKDQAHGKQYFDWQQALEKPLGNNNNYIA